jgi:hypothetical protein
MELAGSHYLDTLVQFSITFAGFAVLVAAFRQVAGGRMLSYDFYVIRTTLVRSFVVAGCGLLPSLLALYELPLRDIWRVSSLIMALLLILFSLTTYLRRRAATSLPVGTLFLIVTCLQVLIAIFLLAIALGIILEPALGHYAAALTATMFVALFGYVASLDLLLRGRSRVVRRK